ncbi:GNAT family N-acetyltransferase [Algoriphagus confluentis]|uniref:GNAT family N-acetyltransferase n=1 Tax=Algoriphagus confluentis TaxID=1697556 RepID=A0ABQ6PUF4_9BACT|nr:GNAT family N-acetyltransferase [Algoriphagus confluentis]
MSLRVEKIFDTSVFEEAVKIRELVFVIEQKVSKADEYDQFEESSTHFLARLDGKPVGTARWRFTENGIKLERFAVLKEARGKGVGKALVEAVLKDISLDTNSNGKVKYLHAQLDAIPLYSKFGFKKVGEMFEECRIQHFKMQLA